jgi:hypothetical protein
MQAVGFMAATLSVGSTTGKNIIVEEYLDRFHDADKSKKGKQMGFTKIINSSFRWFQ